MLIANEKFEGLSSLDNTNEYEGCVFNNCDFSDAYLTSTRFIECEFVESNLSNIHVEETSFLDCVFSHCKMLGIQFDRCNHLLFSASFEGCQLDHATFYQMKLQQTVFNQSSMEGVDFTDAEMKGTKIASCNLLNAKFERTNLQGADLTASTNFTIDPEQNQVSKATFSLSELEGLLTRYNIKIDRKS